MAILLKVVALSNSLGSMENDISGDNSHVVYINYFIGETYTYHY